MTVNTVEEMRFEVSHPAAIMLKHTSPDTKVLNEVLNGNFAWFSYISIHDLMHLVTTDKIKSFALSKAVEGFSLDIEFN